MAEGEKSKSDSFLTLVGRALEQGTAPHFPALMVATGPLPGETGCNGVNIKN